MVDKEHLRLAPEPSYRLLGMAEPVVVDNFSFAREARGHTRREAAPLLGLTLRHLRALERGQVRITQDELRRMCDRYDFPVGFFTRVTERVFDGVFICGPLMDDAKPCAVCGKFSDFLCDFPMGEGRTCDLALCHDHRKRVHGEEDEDDDPNGIDYCLQHALMAEAGKALA